MGFFNFKKKEEEQGLKMTPFAPVATFPEFEDFMGNVYNLSIFPTQIGGTLWYAVVDLSTEEEVVISFFQWLQHAQFFCETYVGVLTQEKSDGSPKEPVWPPENSDSNWTADLFPKGDG